MEEVKTAKSAPRWQSIVLMIIGVVGAVMFGTRLALSSNVDTEKIEKAMSIALFMSGSRMKG